MKPKLLILSDLWGKEDSAWTDYYISVLNKCFEIKYYDCCELGDIDKTNYSEENLYLQFINGGVEKAVENLCKLETDEVIVLAFSIGGYICWKASFMGLRSKNIFAISSTRLRKEFTKPESDIEVFFGENDQFKPDDIWFKTLKIKNQIISNAGHNFYRNKDFAEMLSNKIITQIIPNS